MRCFNKSTRSSARGRVLAGVAALVLLRIVPLAATEIVAAQEPVRRAIEAAVDSRLGPSAHAEVTSIGNLRVLATEGPLVAEPDYSARAGEPSRFALFSAGSRHVRVGEATATVVVTIDAIHTRRYVARGELFQAGDLETRREQSNGGRFLPAPVLGDLVGTKAARDLEAGATVTTADAVPERAVIAGQPVRGLVRVAGVEIEASLVALQSGVINDLIPVMNPGTRRTMRGRVTGRAEVEVIDAR